ncbi:MAG: metal-dependent hydrolase [Thermodesulfobacteriota bacterium]|nr:metal-dependent hydrolase [Deltaproteobacteria bacterium TMED58]RZP16326.1 MAG: metal-dependent hydrolase [Candidatus Dadabacteria bacterium]|tara:strand:+ start:75106 stop:75822 length:717 start_codon:yes stop_codon:yes gene_type:complete
MKNKEVDIQFVGHSTFILDDKQGTRILIDPWLKNNPACPEDLQEPKDIDYILITHGHFDHIGDLFAAIDINKEAKIVTSLEVSSWLNAKGISNTLPMGIGGSQPLDNDIKVVMVNAVHASGIADDKSESMLYGGVANGYVVEFRNGFSIYFAGDTAIFSDMNLIREIYSPDLAVLPIGDHFTMGPKEASYATKLLGAKHVIPFHYGTFPVLIGTPEEYIELVKDLDVSVYVMNPGDVL